jgi:Holliday junction resolvase RusA-like endonuclease
VPGRAVISIEVLGTPAPKGSMRAIAVNGRGRVIAGGSKANQRAQYAWTKAIQTAVISSIGDRDGKPYYVDQPLEVHLLFRLVRPSNHYGKRGLKSGAPLHPMVMRDDIDKLARSTLDALTGALYDDDGRIVTLVLCKQYAASEALQGVVITIDALPISVQGSLLTTHNDSSISNGGARTS